MRKAPPPPPVKTVVKPTSSTEIDLTGATTPQQIIFQAMMLYIDTPGLSMRKMWDTRRLVKNDDSSPLYKDVISFNTLERAAIKQRWAPRREEHWAAVETQVLNTLQTAAVKREVEELRQLEGVESVLLSHIHGVTDEDKKVLIPAAKPKSLEGAVGALVSLSKYRDTKRERVQKDIAGRATLVDDVDDVILVETVASEDGYDDDDIAAMSLAVASKRAGLITDKSKAGDDDDGVE